MSTDQAPAILLTLELQECVIHPGIRLDIAARHGIGMRFILEMSDPRNVAHNKKVAQEKHHQEEASPPARKRRAKPKSEPVEEPPVENAPGELEKSMAVLSKLKEMEFHSRANIETLAGLILEIEEELKQKEFSEPIGALYSAQDALHTKTAALIESYQAKCDSLKPSA
jgi:hypothetical protein